MHISNIFLNEIFFAQFQFNFMITSHKNNLNFSIRFILISNNTKRIYRNSFTTNFHKITDQIVLIFCHMMQETFYLVGLANWINDVHLVAIYLLQNHIMLLCFEGLMQPCCFRCVWCWQQHRPSTWPRSLHTRHWPGTLLALIPTLDWCISKHHAGHTLLPAYHSVS